MCAHGLTPGLVAPTFGAAVIDGGNGRPGRKASRRQAGEAFWNSQILSLDKENQHPYKPVPSPVNEVVSGMLKPILCG